MVKTRSAPNRKPVTRVPRPSNNKKKSPMQKLKKALKKRSRVFPTALQSALHSNSTGRIKLGGGRVSGATTRRAQIIEEDEYIGEISGSVGFATTGYAVNPGQQTTFPWGYKIAQLYDEYEYQSLEFYYKREVSEFSTNGQAGKIMLSFDYDATDGAPTTKQQVEDTVPHNDGMPCTEKIVLKINCAQIKKNDSHYVRPGAQPANTDLKTYDAGNLWVSTYGCTNATVIGELRVRYRVKLMQPVLDQATTQGGAVHFSGTLPTTADNFATSVQQTGASPQLAGITAAANVITFPAGIPGNYLINLSILAATSASVIGMSPGSGVTSLNLITNTTRDSTSQAVSAAATAAKWATMTYTVTVATGGGTITVSPSTIVGGAGMDLFIVNLPASVLTVVQRDHSRIEEQEQRLKRLERMLERATLVLPESERESPIHRESFEHLDAYSGYAPRGLTFEYKDGTSETVDLSKSQLSIAEKILRHKS